MRYIFYLEVSINDFVWVFFFAVKEPDGKFHSRSFKQPSRKSSNGVSFCLLVLCKIDFSRVLYNMGGVSFGYRIQDTCDNVMYS